MKKTLTILATSAFLIGCQPQDTTIDEPAGAPRRDIDRGMTNDTNGAVQSQQQPQQYNPPATDQN